MLDELKMHTETEGNCLLWRGRVVNGYGIIEQNGKRQYVHRLAWEDEHKRDLRKGEQVTHTCGTKLCVNPNHIELRYQPSVEDRFWDKVDRGADDECWEWLGNPDLRFKYDGESVPARRMAWALDQGNPDLIYELVSDDYVIPNSCYNSKCVNPAHLAIVGEYDVAFYREYQDELSLAEETCEKARMRDLKSCKLAREPVKRMSWEDLEKQRELEEYKQRTPTVDDILAMGYDVSAILSVNDNRIPVAGPDCQEVMDRLTSQ